MKTEVRPAALLSGIVEPLSRGLTPASARDLLAVQPDQRVRRRLARLARKCDEGTLTPEERAEYQVYVDVGDFVALLQVRARRVIARQTGA